MDNYAISLEAARQHFLTYDMCCLSARQGVKDRGDTLHTSFFAEDVLVDKTTGSVTVGGRGANFIEGLSVYDWLCDRKTDAVAAGEFCTVSNLSGVYVSGSGLSMNATRLAGLIDKAPAAFEKCCAVLGGKAVPLGDMGYQLSIFPELPMVLKFYFSDEDFSPVLTFMWDRNTLQFVRYETVYYLAGCLESRLLRLMLEVQKDQGG